MKKKFTFITVAVPVTFIFLFGMSVVSVVSSINGVSMLSSGGFSCSTDDDSEDSDSDSNTQTKTVSVLASVDEFVRTYEEAYIESWGVGGFLPSASIAQTMIETSFSYSVPSFADAHNMGGVKGGGAESFPKTIALYGSDAVGSGSSGTSVGDGTGGSYTYFATFESGIVGKAEFMSRQTLYTKAINNTDGKSTLDAIADGGWATDTSYKTKLESMYDSLGSQYKWLDEKAIDKYGSTPVNLSDDTSSSSVTSDDSDDSDTDSDTSSDCGDDTDSATDGTGEVPSDATAWGYKPSDVPDSLKQYIHNPEDLGLAYSGTEGWLEHSGQCVDLTESLGNKIWGYTGITRGNGIAQASAWASKFGNSVKSSPKSGAIFSSGTSDPGHTGIVSHVFADGSILIIEQNTPLSGSDYFGVPNTWNYRIVSPTTQKSDNFVFAYPDDKEPNWSSSSSSSED